MNEVDILKSIATRIREGAEIYRSDRLSVYSDICYLWNTYRKLKLEFGRSVAEAEVLNEAISKIRSVFVVNSDSEKRIREIADIAKVRVEKIWSAGMSL